MAGAGDSLVKQYPPATHQFLEVPFIETDLEQGPWLVRPMKYDDKFRPVEDWTGWTHTEFCVDTLIDLTTAGA